MCGRYDNDLTTERLREAFKTVAWGPQWRPCRNIAPKQPAPIVHRDPKTGQRHLDLRLWGFIPAWATDMDRQPFNARAETVVESGFFRAAFQSRRCLVPATAYYAWRRGGSQSCAFARADGTPLALAGVWEAWGWEGDILRTFAIITTQANALMRPIQDRMPVVIEARDWDAWLEAPVEVAAHLMQPTPDGVLTCSASPRAP
jgi:putative SOS response-associated peptidase YedK